MLVTGTLRGSKDLSGSKEEEKPKVSEKKGGNVLTVPYGSFITFLPPEEKLSSDPAGLITLKRVGNHLVAYHHSETVGESYAQQLTTTLHGETGPSCQEWFQ